MSRPTLARSSFDLRRLLAPTLTAGLLVPCALAQAPGQFPEVAQQRGLTWFVPFLDVHGHGIGAMDLDGDLDPDVVLTGGAADRVGIFENQGNGFFTDHTLTSGIPIAPATTGVMAFDFDGDGDLDLYISRWNQPNLLLENLGGFAFVDVAAIAGVADTGKGTGAAAGDYDGDGWLDFYLANYTGTSLEPRNRLFRNLGNGTFQSVETLYGMDDQAPSFQGVFLDADLDGDLDLYVSNDKGQGSCGWRNHIWRNDNGSFVDATNGSGLGVCINSMGVTFGDIDHDTRWDVYCTNTPHGNPLLVSQSHMLWADEALARGVLSNRTGWGTAFYDFDGDTDLDLWVNNQSASNRFYVNNGSGVFSDMGPQFGVNDPASSYCLAVADLDGDGDLDTLVQSLAADIDMYENPEGSLHRWARFALEFTAPNRFAVGALLEARIGTAWQRRSVQSGTNYKSQNEFVQTFGADTARRIDELVVTWPDGSTRTLTDYPTNRTWRVPAAALLGDVDRDGDVDHADFVAFVVCRWAPAFFPGCEACDLDGDADVDDLDFPLFLARYSGPRQDCNANGILDLAEILASPASDAGSDGVLDSCQAPGGLVGDLDQNGVVNVNDMNMLLRAMGRCGAVCPADLDDDGAVTFADLWILLAFWS